MLIRNIFYTPKELRLRRDFFAQKNCGGVYLPSKEKVFQRYIDSKGLFEASKLNAALEHCGSARSVAVDVGASVGLFTKSLAEKFSLVIAIEPVSSSRACIYRNLPPGCNNVIVLPYCLSNSQKHKEIHVSDIAVGGSTLLRENLEKITRTEPVISICLDSIIGLVGDDSIDFIKIDVQGAELDVLESGSKLLELHRPVFLVETSSSSHSLDLAVDRYFSQYDYVKVKRIGRDAIYVSSLK